MAETQTVESKNKERDQKILELAKTCSEEELEAMIQVDADSIESTTNQAFKYGAVISAVIVVIIALIVEPPRGDMSLGVAMFFGFVMSMLPATLISGVVLCGSSGDPTPGVPYGTAKEALKIKQNWVAYQEWQNKQS